MPEKELSATQSRGEGAEIRESESLVEALHEAAAIPLEEAEEIAGRTLREWADHVSPQDSTHSVVRIVGGFFAVAATIVVIFVVLLLVVLFLLVF